MSTELQLHQQRIKNHTGIGNLPLSVQDTGGLSLQVDFEKLLEQPDHRSLLQSIPPPVIYHSLALADPETKAQMVPLLSNEQFLRILDYDTWKSNELDQERALMWLAYHRSQGPMAMARRFRALEEEYQLAIVDRSLRVFDPEEVERMPDHEKDGLIPFPGGYYHYQIVTSDEGQGRLLQELIESAMALDLKYAFNIVTHAAYIPPREAEYQLSQFRAARLEEDGFVGYEEALHTIIPETIPDEDAALMAIPSPNKDLLLSAVSRLTEIGQWDVDQGFQLQQSCLFVANAVMSALQIDPSESDETAKILQQVKAMINLGLDALAKGSIEMAAEQLKTTSIKKIFRVGLGVSHSQQLRFVPAFFASRPQAFRDQLLRQLRALKYAVAMDTIDNLVDQYSAEVFARIKGLLNRFPMSPVVTAENRLSFLPIQTCSELNQTYQLLMQERIL